MPVDPQFAPTLAYLTAMPPMRSTALIDVRSQILPPYNVTPVTHVEDREISTPDGTLAVRIYKPNENPNLPLVVFFHGGGFVLGSLNTHDELVRRLACASNSVVVSVEYRLAPEHPYPAASNDCIAAVSWAAAHAAELGADSNRLAIAGDSAGGNLAAVTAIRLRDEGGPALMAQLLIYPSTDLASPHEGSMAETGEGFYMTQDDMNFYEQSYVAKADARDPHISPAYAHSLARLAPALVITAEFDPLRDQGKAYAKRLLDEGNEAEHLHYDGAIHGFLMFPGPMGLDAIQKSGEWLKRRLK